MKNHCLATLLLPILILTISRVVLSTADEDLLKKLGDWNAWAEENAKSENFKAKAYQPRVETLNEVSESSGGLEALQFMRMYRYNHKGDIPDKIKLFKDFYEGQEEIQRDKFYQLAAVWLRRQHFEMTTGENYAFQVRLKDTIENTHSYLHAKEELKNVRVEHLWYEFDKYFYKMATLDLVDAAHWLVDGNLYAGIGVARIKDIFDEEMEIIKPEVVEDGLFQTDDAVKMKMLEDLVMPEELQEVKHSEENIAIIDL